MENIPSIFHPLSDSPSGEQEANGWGEPANRENRPSAHSYGRVPHTLPFYSSTCQLLPSAPFEEGPWHSIVDVTSVRLS